MTHTQQPVELRSDTFTKPTKDMLAFMMAAEVGDDVYGEDPSVRKLEEKVARITGKEAALFVPSGTMGNQLGMNVHTRPGDSVMIEKESHVFYYEAGGGAVLSGLQFDEIPWDEKFSDAAIEAAYKKEDIHFSTTSLVVVENTHNRNAGRALHAGEMLRIANKAKELGLATHCDGARIWNAAVATGDSERDLLAGYDTVSVCFSKGLGAPIGSALCGPRRLIERARKVRKRWGGGMRQAGFLAAAASYALDHHRVLLAKDHARARTLAEELCTIFGERGFVHYPECGTNIVYFGLRGVNGDDLTRHFRVYGINLSHLGHGKLRAVTHLGVSDSDIARTIDAAKKIIQLIH